MPRWVGVMIFGLALSLAGAAEALAPPPVKPVDTDRVMGRWYEILRTPNEQQKNCFGAYQDWMRKGGDYSIRHVCHRDSREGAQTAITTNARSLNPQNTEFEITFFAGLIRARYWMTDHADDYSWIIATTEGGHYPKLLARTPGLPPAEQDRLKQHMADLGFDVSKLEAVGQ
jgi:apolipoprotein D and lipocalin family protein